MIFEQLVFTILAFALFVLMFFKMLKENDTNYVAILVLEAFGIALNFIQVLGKVNIGIFLIIIKYIFGVFIPIGVIILEKNKISLIQLFSVAKATIYLNLGNSKKAKEELINLVSKEPENYIGHKMLAEIYELEGGMRKAIDEYVQAVDINKQDYNSYFRIAELLTDLDKVDEAEQMLFSLLNKKPDYIKATELLGDILISKEMYKEAANIYQEGLKYNPMSFEINYNLGIVYTMLNDFQSAQIFYEKAAYINSLAYNCKYSLAEIALIYRELEEAERYFMEALEDEELSAESYYELSKISMIKGDKEKAIQYANIAIDIDAKKVANKFKTDPIFISILAKISIPFNLENNENNEINKNNEKKLSEKELKAKRHLEKMFELTRNLSYDDIKMLKKNESGKNKKIEEKQNEQQREIE